MGLAVIILLVDVDAPMSRALLIGRKMHASCSRLAAADVGFMWANPSQPTTTPTIVTQRVSQFSIMIIVSMYFVFGVMIDVWCEQVVLCGIVGK